MWAALRSRSSSFHPWKQGIAVPPGLNPTAFSSSSFTTATTNKAFLSLQEIEKVLNDVRADDVKVLSVPNMHADWADYVVLATGRSTWHVKNIAQALIYKAKQKQKGVDRKVLPSVEGQEEGKWIVIDSGKIIVHALDEKAREYYNLEGLWTTETSQKQPNLVHVHLMGLEPRTLSYITLFRKEEVAIELELISIVMASSYGGKSSCFQFNLCSGLRN